jgi:methylated-DNA-[protein]-cysteine S-methyltransferase
MPGIPTSPRPTPAPLGTCFSTTCATPVGPVALAVDARGALAALTFADESTLPALLPPGATLVHHPGETAEAVAQLRAYFGGELRRFTLPLAPAPGTPFQRRVWAALQCIPWGTTWSYKKLARETGSGPRAVAQANRANPLCIAIPCHRVIAADGTLGGYSGGLDRKRWLLRHEASPPS